MRLLLDHLGGIPHADLEIRPFTVFVGANNTNKTWAAYCLWDLARRVMVGNPSGIDDPVLPLEPTSARDRVEAAVAREVARSPKHLDSSVSVARKDLIDGIDETITFRLPHADINALLNVRLPADASAALVTSAEEFQKEASVVELRVENSLRRATVTYKGEGVPVQFAAQWSGSTGGDPMPTFLHSILTRLAHGFLGRAVLLLLPAERKALVQIYKLLDAAPSPLIGQVMAAPVLDPYLTKPPIHFMRFLKAAEPTYERTGPATRFAKALEHLEGRVQGGAIDYERRGPGVRIYFTMRAGGELPLEASSSLVRALAGLNIYLRHWANPGDLLILDEPEMNAHPDAQLGITELLATLVNKGVRVVITTHSPYLIDHLGTLVEASQLKGEARKHIVQKLRLRDEQALLAPDKLAVYRFTEGCVTSIFDEEARSIDPSIFSEVGAAEANLFSEVLSAERLRGD